MVRLYNKDLDSLTIANEDDLNEYLQEYDKKDIYSLIPSGLILVKDSMFDDHDELKNIVEMLHNKALPHTFLVGLNELYDGYDLMLDDVRDSFIAKNSFYKRFHVNLSLDISDVEVREKYGIKEVSERDKFIAGNVLKNLENSYSN